MACIMKILFFYSRMDLGGIQSAFYNRIKALNRLGITSHILFYRQGPARDTYQDIRMFVTSDGNEITEIIRENRYDCLVWINQTAYLREWMENNQTGGNKCKVMLEIRGMDYYTYHLLANEIRSALIPIDAIVTPAEHLTEKVRHMIGNKYPVKTIPNCIDAELFSTNNDCAEQRDLVPHPINGRKVLCWIGRLDSNKNWIEYCRFFLLCCPGTKTGKAGSSASFI